MTKLYNLLAMDRPKTGDVGLELEVEGEAALPVVNEKTWRTKEDGSLRGFGAEYVSSKPIPVDATKRERIEYLCGMLAKPEHRVNTESPRTSLHVHVNITDLTPTQIWTAITTYWLLENALMKFCGHDREGNLFCLRLTDAEAALSTCLQDIKGRVPFQVVFNDRIRYMAQNLKAIRQFGSLEYRGMRGTIDPEIIDTWSTQLHNLVHRSVVNYRTPSEVLDAHFRGRDVLGSVLDNSFVTRLRNLCDTSSLIDENSGLLCELAYGTNWEKFQERLDTPMRVIAVPPPRQPRPDNPWRVARVEGAGGFNLEQMARLANLPPLGNR